MEESECEPAWFSERIKLCNKTQDYYKPTGSPLWNHAVTGPHVEEIFRGGTKEKMMFSGFKVR